MAAGKSDRWRERGLRDAVLRGDGEAWRTLYVQTFDPLYAFVDFRTGHRRDRTDEIVQDVWMVAVRRIETFDPDRAGFGSWLRGIAANVIRNHSRKWKRNEAVSQTEEAADEGAPGTRAELAEQIGLAMTALPERYRTVLLEKYRESLTVDEIAGRRGESVKTVESLLTRARTAFRELFQRYDGEP